MRRTTIRPDARSVSIAASAAILLLAAACAGGPSPSTPVSPQADPAPLRFNRPIVLLGEVHDNAVQHALRLRALRDWVEGGARPALAMEQFDREHQPALDRALAQPGATADSVVAAAGGGAAGMSGWDWAFYKPYIALAIEYRLPVIAANVSRADARSVMRDGLAAQGFDASVPEPLLRRHAAGIEASHCGMLDAATASRMALAQVARDQYMARVVEANAHRGVLLLAGNGHVRTDVGVPRWLTPATRARSVAIGVVESDDGESAYDERVVTVRQPRSDPCAQMRRPAAASAASAAPTARP